MTTDNNEGVTPSSDAAGVKPAPQDDLNDGGKRALDAERKARRDAESEAKRLRDQLAARDRSDAIQEVARAKGLPSELAERLRGESREELEADADELLKALAPQEATSHRGMPKEKLRDGAASRIDDEGPNMAQVAAEILK